MNDTVAVALITSLSTLTAAAVTGAISVCVNGRQLRHQEALAREESAEQLAIAQRDMRREACESFLSRADAAYRTLDAAWSAPADPDREAGFASRRALDEAHIRLQLVGPDDLAEQGASVVASITDEFRLLTDTSTPSSHSRALRVRSTVTAAFAQSARRALEASRSPDASSAAEESSRTREG